MRYLLYLTEGNDGEEVHYLIDRRNDFWFIQPNALHFPVPNAIERFHKQTLIDGELVVDKMPNGHMQPKYLVFDCLFLDGNSLMERTLDKRLAYFTERIGDPYKQLLKNYPQEIPYYAFILELKKMEFSYAISMMFLQTLPSLPHGNDGLIFTCRTTPYQSGTDPNILKWKPEDENSIDFRLEMEFEMIQPDKQDIAEGIREPYPDYDSIPQSCNLFIFCGDGKPDKWFGSLFLEPSEWESLKARGEPLQDRIVECYMDARKRWRFMRFRDDKPQANFIGTAESVIESIKDRVTKEELIQNEKAIRDEWKAREERERKMRKAAAVGQVPNGTGAAGVKRKAEEQGAGRPSPGAPTRT